VGEENFFAGVRPPRVGIVPVAEDAATLYETWLGGGG